MQPEKASGRDTVHSSCLWERARDQHVGCEMGWVSSLVLLDLAHGMAAAGPSLSFLGVCREKELASLSGSVGTGCLEEGTAWRSWE